MLMALHIHFPSGLNCPDFLKLYGGALTLNLLFGCVFVVCLSSMCASKFVMKSRPRLIDVPHQDDVFQENVDIHEGSIIDVTNKDVGPLVHEFRSSKELDIAVEIYFEEVQNDEIEIE
ncbi:hypothetical protein M9H77_26723 [Catharanthus roseus]|uniref:Uncharacterized protein n=1 Tax=Catharanthus roseus TaxID=4058 RepID=A0ACC0AC12_CATRO|nr:hypothetical protein M9H77_26723 [Catharanthus roseus]